MDEEEIRELVDRAAAGDGEAAGRLVRLYELPVKAAIHRRLGPELRSRVDTEDIFQSAILEAVGGLSGFQYRGEEALVGWLTTIAEWRVRKAAKHHRVGKRDLRKQLPLEAAHEVPGGGTSPTQGAVRAEVTRGIRRAMDRLPEPDREVVHLRAYDGLTFGGIAERVGLEDEDAARYVLQRAMRKLGELLDPGHEL